MFGQDSYSGYNIRGLAGVGAFLMFAAFVAAIVLAVIIYRKYAKGYNDNTLDLRSPSALRSFLRFDTLIIDRILIVTYIFFALLAPFLSLATSLSAMFADFTAGFVALLGTLVFTVFFEIGLRLGYEFIMLQVTIARNVSDLRNAQIGGRPVSSTGAAPSRPRAPRAASSHAPAGAPMAAPIAVQSPAPRPRQADADATIQCPNCGATLPAGAHFCASCGSRI